MTDPDRPPTDDASEMPDDAHPSREETSREPGAALQPEAGAAAPDAGEPAELRCGTCDTLLQPDQTYCLECGAPTELAPRLRRRGRAAWALAGGLVILGLGAGALAYAISEDDEGAATSSVGGFTAGSTVLLPPDTTLLPTDTSGLPPVTDVPGGTDTFATDGFPTDTLATDTAPTDGFPTDTGGPVPTDITEPPTDFTPPPPPPTTEAFSSDWPAGRTAFTAILSSVRSLTEARSTRDRVRDETGEPAGILFSSDHAGLETGYYVVFSGVYSTHAQAVEQASSLSGDYPGAYPRRIVDS